MCTYLDQVRSTYYFRRVVPAELRPFILTRTGKPRAEWKVSLGTKDRNEAKRLLPKHTLQTNSQIDEALERLAEEVAEIGPEKPVQPRPARAEAMETTVFEHGLEAAEIVSRKVAEQEARQEAREDERVYWRKRIGFTTRELTPREAAVKDLLGEKDFDLELARNEIAHLRRNLREARAAGDPDRLARPAPAPAPTRHAVSGQSVLQSSGAVPLIETFDAYAKEQGMKPVTAQDWKGVLRSLVRFLGHDDAARFTVEDIDRWRDALLTEQTKRSAARSPRTVKDKYLSALRSTLNYAVSKRLLSDNVASKVVVRVPRQTKLRERDFTNVEAKAILSATLKTHTDAPELTQRARRWIPWLCAYTGARVNEISQLRGADVAEIDGIWTIHITPDAGTVKSGEARVVPLHPHLIEQGFLAFVEKAGSGALFYDPSRVRKPGAANRHVTKVGERLAAWVRDAGGIKDPNVQPNHGWRHLFKTRAVEAGMPERVADAIQGHAPRSVGQTYGRVSLQAMNEAVGALPRFEAA